MIPADFPWRAGMRVMMKIRLIHTCYRLGCDTPSGLGRRSQPLLTIYTLRDRA